jgi:hypothetical protein
MTVVPKQSKKLAKGEDKSSLNPTINPSVGIDEEVKEQLSERSELKDPCLNKRRKIYH